MKRYLAVFFAIMGPLAAQAGDLLALPGASGTDFWDTTATPPVPIFKDVKSGAPGTCYVRQSKQKLVPDQSDFSCLTYLVQDKNVVTGGAAVYQISGQIVPMSRGIDEVFQGFALKGVKGVENCGERSNCDTIFIAGVTSRSVLKSFSEAVRTGSRVSVKGPGVWQSESIDIVIQDISPIK